MAYHLRVLQDLPELGLVANDVIIYDPANLREPYTLYRAIPLDPGAILNQLHLDAPTIEAVDIIPASLIPAAKRRASAPRVLPWRPKDQQAG